MSDRRGGGRPPRKPYEGRGERSGGPPRNDERRPGPPRQGPGRGDGPPSRGRYRDEGPPSRGRPRDDRPRDDRPRDDRPRDDRPTFRERYRDDAPPPRARPREETPPPRDDRREDAPPPWQREQRPPRPGPRGDVAGPAIIPPPSYKPEDLAKAAEKVAAACIEVQRQLGNGLEATTYHRALALELQARSIFFEREARIPVAYKERQIDTRKVDFVVDGCIVEILSQADVSEATVARHTNYLKASGYQIAVLVNFGPPKVEVRTLVA